MDVAGWLGSLGLEQYAQAFADNAVDAALLPALTRDDLKELGRGRGRASPTHARRDRRSARSGQLRALPYRTQRRVSAGR